MSTSLDPRPPPEFEQFPLNSLLSLLFEFLLLDVFLLDMLHHFAAMCEIDFQAMRHSLGNFHELIVNHGTPGNLPARRNQMCAPLKDKSNVPNNEQSQDRAHDR